MGRLSRQILEQYKELPSKFHGCCFYCNKPQDRMQNELTPSHLASDVAKAEFEDEWTCVKVCNICWPKIYKANIMQGAAKFRVRPGTMTLDMKRTLLGLAPVERIPNQPVEWVLNGSYMVPSGTALGDEGDFFIGDKRFTREEMDALQPTMTCIMTKREDHVAHMSLRHALSSGELDIAREELYREILSLNRITQHTGELPW